MKLTADDPAVREALQGVFRSNRTTFFRVSESGEHVHVSVFNLLRPLGISHGGISDLFKTFPFPELRYQSEFMKKVAEAKSHRKVSGPKALSEDEREEKRLRKEEADNTKRYQLIQQGSYHGIWDDSNATVISLWHTKSEAVEELVRIKAGRAYAGLCNWGSYKPQRSMELQESHS
jgi:hypothetical protein